MSNKELIDHETLRAHAIKRASVFFDGQIDPSVLIRGNCYDKIVPAFINLPTQKSAEFLDRILGPNGASIPNHFDLISFWWDLKELKPLCPEPQQTSERVINVARPFIESGKLVEIFETEDHIDFIQRKTNPFHKNHKPHELTIPMYITLEMLKALGYKHEPAISAHIRKLSCALTRAIYEPDFDESNKRQLMSEFELIRIGTWPIGVDSFDTLHIFVPPAQKA